MAGREGREGGREGERKEEGGAGRDGDRDRMAVLTWCPGVGKMGEDGAAEGWREGGREGGREEGRRKRLVGSEKKWQ